jgi:phenylpropionate dioxygenase-like ring-hydroxylating dioxygenase large terminal subunit
MIRNQWYAILESTEVRPGKPVGVTRMGEKLVLWRDQSGKLACLVDQCPHRGVALSKGKLVANQIQCPFHGFEYDTTGRCTFIPANGINSPVPLAFQVPDYPVHEEYGFIWIWWGEQRADLPKIAFFDSIPADMSYSTIKDHWRTHYSRAIENQLDVVHLPFVHHNTIGRGNRALVDGPLYRWECQMTKCDLLNLWVYNRVDDGSKPRKPESIADPDRNPMLQFRYPNLWQNWIGDKIRIVVAFAPIDDENTMMYLRFYQDIIRVPILKQIMEGIGSLGNLIIERQDKRVVETQMPKRSHLRMGEKLIQGDGPIIAYRRGREKLIRQNGADHPQEMSNPKPEQA